MNKYPYCRSSGRFFSYVWCLLRHCNDCLVFRVWHENGRKTGDSFHHQNILFLDKERKVPVDKPD